MATFQELMAQKAALERQQAELEKAISEARRAERAGVIAQIRALMAEHGLTLADLGASAAAKPSKAPKADGETRKVAPKYIDRATGASWTGRGLKPKWLTAALDAGRKLEDFAV